MLIGRLTRDPEVRVFGNGGKVAKLGFAVNNRRKNQQTGQWEDEPVFIDMEVFNRGETGKQADLVENSLKKGHQVFIEGHLRMDNWTDKEGQKRSKVLVVVDNFQFLERREDGGGGQRMSSAPRQSQPSNHGNGYNEAPEEPQGHGGDDIPF
jgi:single-strand DNA-binding protein